MRVILQVPDIGDILYEESYWTGKKTVTINGKSYQKASKTTYVYMDGEKEHYITLNGSFLSGVSVTFGNGVTVKITEKPAWYEWLLSGAGFLFVLIWGNVPVSADIERVNEEISAVIEALASESYRRVYTAYYESALKTAYNRDDYSAQMVDIITGQHATVKSILTKNFVYEYSASIA